METKVVVEPRDVYGTRRIYPANGPAHLLAQLAGTKTLSPNDLYVIRQLGFEIIETFTPSVPK